MARKTEAERKHELVQAAIQEVGASGTLNVSVGQIAKAAGVSPGLAFHYFHDKDGLLLAAIRHILSIYASEVNRAVKAAVGPRARVEAIIRASFGEGSFERHAIGAWINFYALALRSDPAKRLLQVYQRRLQSNLVHALRPLCGARAPDVARRIGGLIDGLYLRYALDPDTNHGAEGASHVLRALEAELALAAAEGPAPLDPSPTSPLAGPQD
ncbi:transcriptional regulator BetI [Rhodovulum sp. DZ06]|uniref:transcriptional regulator BetI n=1 Tax=Rhodovulum sp. DZ06 TaxID=3425126 RepID=UPI003D335EE7